VEFRARLHERAELVLVGKGERAQFDP
jgi:hypothetical protein